MPPSAPNGTTRHHAAAPSSSGASRTSARATVAGTEADDERSTGLDQGSMDDGHFQTHQHGDDEDEDEDDDDDDGIGHDEVRMVVSPIKATSAPTAPSTVYTSKDARAEGSSYDRAGRPSKRSAPSPKASASPAASPAERPRPNAHTTADETERRRAGVAKRRKRRSELDGLGFDNPGPAMLQPAIPPSSPSSDDDGNDDDDVDSQGGRRRAHRPRIRRRVVSGLASAASTTTASSGEESQRRSLLLGRLSAPSTSSSSSAPTLSNGIAQPSGITNGSSSSLAPATVEVQQWPTRQEVASAATRPSPILSPSSRGRERRPSVRTRDLDDLPLLASSSSSSSPPRASAMPTSPATKPPSSRASGGGVVTPRKARASLALQDDSRDTAAARGLAGGRSSAPRGSRDVTPRRNNAGVAEAEARSAAIGGDSLAEGRGKGHIADERPVANVSRQVLGRSVTTTPREFAANDAATTTSAGPDAAASGAGLTLETVRRTRLEAATRSLERTHAEHDLLVRELFHLTKFVTLIGYDPEVALRDRSDVFNQFALQYDLASRVLADTDDDAAGGAGGDGGRTSSRTASGRQSIGVGARATRRSVQQRMEVLSLLKKPATPAKSEASRAVKPLRKSQVDAAKAQRVPSSTPPPLASRSKSPRARHSAGPGEGVPDVQASGRASLAAEARRPRKKHATGSGSEEDAARAASTSRKRRRASAPRTGDGSDDERESSRAEASAGAGAGAEAKPRRVASKASRKAEAKAMLPFLPDVAAAPFDFEPSEACPTVVAQLSAERPLRGRGREPRPRFLHPGHVPAGRRFGGDVEALWSSFSCLGATASAADSSWQDGWEEVSVEQGRQREAETLESLLKIDELRVLGVLNLAGAGGGGGGGVDGGAALSAPSPSMLQPPKPPPKVMLLAPGEQKTPHESLLADVASAASRLRSEARARATQCRRVSRMVQAYWDARLGVGEKARRAEERRVRQLAKWTSREVSKQWRLAVNVVRARKAREEKEESEQRRREQLREMIEESAARLGRQVVGMRGGQTAGRAGDGEGTQEQDGTTDEDDEDDDEEDDESSEGSDDGDETESGESEDEDAGGGQDDVTDEGVDGEVQSVSSGGSRSEEEEECIERAPRRRSRRSLDAKANVTTGRVDEANAQDSAGSELESDVYSVEDDEQGASDESGSTTSTGDSEDLEADGSANKEREYVSRSTNGNGTSLLESMLQHPNSESDASDGTSDASVNEGVESEIAESEDSWTSESNERRRARGDGTDQMDVSSSPPPSVAKNGKRCEGHDGGSDSKHFEQSSKAPRRRRSSRVADAPNGRVSPHSGVEVNGLGSAASEDEEAELERRMWEEDEGEEGEDEGLLADAELSIDELKRRYGYPDESADDVKAAHDDASFGVPAPSSRKSKLVQLLGDVSEDDEDGAEDDKADGEKDYYDDDAGSEAASSSEIGDGKRHQTNGRHSGRHANVDPAPSASKDGRARSESERTSTTPARRDGGKPGEVVAPERRQHQPFLLRGTLRPYQQIGFEWLANLYATGANGILADEMGLGKTIQTIALLAYLACDKGIWGPHLVVAPTSVMLNWEVEFKKFLPGFKILSYYGSQKERKEKRRGWNTENSFHVCITSYQLILADQHIFRRKPWVYLVLDEAHHIKNFRSQRWQTLLGFNTQRRLLLTGTPLQNNLMDLWSLMYFLMPQGVPGDMAGGDGSAATGFASMRDFQEWFSNPLDRAVESGEGIDTETQQMVGKLHTLLRPYLLRRLKSEVERELPRKYEHVVPCRLSKRQRFLYNDFMSRAKTKESLATGNYLSVINVLMQLRKVCNHPDLFEVRPIVTGFAAPRSVVAEYEIKELLVRRELLREAETQCDEIALSVLNLDVVHQEMHMTPIYTRDLRRLDASARLPFAGEKRVDVTRLPEVRTSGSVEEYQRTLSLRENAERAARWQHLAYLNRFRCLRSPVFGEGLRRMVWELGERARLAPYAQVERDRRRHLSRCDAAHRLAQSLDERGTAYSPYIERFAFVTPRAMALDMPRWALPWREASQLPASLVHSVSPGGEGDDQGPSAADALHLASVKLNIAFPDASLLQYDCGKLQQLDLLMRRLRDGGHRVLIFTQMTRMLDILEAWLNLQGYRYLRLDGATRVEQRQSLTEKFNRDARITAFILSTRSGGLGINLTGADAVIFYDLDWNAAIEAQCMDRAHRIGQTRDVHIYRFCSQHTVEENMLRKANQKRMLDDVVIGQGDFTTEALARVDWRDMLDDGGTLGGVRVGVTAAAGSGGGDKVERIVEVHEGDASQPPGSVASPPGLSASPTSTRGPPPPPTPRPPPPPPPPRAGESAREVERALLAAEDEEDAVAARAARYEMNVVVEEPDFGASTAAGDGSGGANGAARADGVGATALGGVGDGAAEEAARPLQGDDDGMEEPEEALEEGADLEAGTVDEYMLRRVEAEWETHFCFWK